MTESNLTDLIPSIAKLTKDLREASKTLQPNEARFLVDAYYIMQEDRKRFDNQLKALAKSGEPNAVLVWMSKESGTLENQIKFALDKFSTTSVVGQWARAQVGIGPVIASGLSAYIDITKANTAGQIQRYAGLDPTVKWLSSEKTKNYVKEVRNEKDNDWDAFLTCTEYLQRKPLTILLHKGLIEEIPLMSTTLEAIEDLLGFKVKPKAVFHPDNLIRELVPFEKRYLIYQAITNAKFDWDTITKALCMRPWNASLKTLCWHMGECFMKVSNKEDAFYGKIYANRKIYETEKNANGDYKNQAETILKTKRIGHETEAYKHLVEGRLPPAQILARSKRYAAKFFLSHWHHVAYKDYYKKDPPAPFAIAHLGHVDFVPPPGV